MRLVGHVAHMGESRGVHKVLVGKPEGKRPLGRSRHRREDIKLDLQEVECKGMGWIDLVQGRHTWVGSSEHNSEPSGSIKCRVLVS